MSYPAERRLLQALLAVLGATAAVAGLFAVLSGPDGQLDGAAVGASIDSEYRFYAALWLGFGAVALALVPRVERETLAVRALAAVLFAAGVARVLAWIDTGRPHGVFLALLALELAIPPVLVVWQARIRARGGDRRHAGSGTV
ncbi:MAG TPA: DUF4345 domain-containing protein [Solirubrobacterales bacterium]